MIPTYQHRSSHLRVPRAEQTKTAVAEEKVHAETRPSVVLDLTASQYTEARKRGQERGRKTRRVVK